MISHLITKERKNRTIKEIVYWEKAKKFPTITSYIQRLTFRSVLEHFRTVDLICVESVCSTNLAK